MLDVCRIKKTKQIVYPIGLNGPNYTLCLFPFSHVSKKNKRGVIQAVRNSNIVRDRESLNG